jgi:peptide/nickel transport system substrate-binding protein
MMSDARVRHAFELSLDRPGINQVVFNGLHTPIAQGVPPESPFYNPDITVPARDLAKAKALLAEAGVKTPMTVELSVSNDPVNRQIGEVIQSMAGEAGFDVKLRTMEFVSLLKATDEGDYEVYLIGWSGRVDIDGNVYNGLKTKGPLNSSGYSSIEADLTLDLARVVTDIPQRRTLYGMLARRLNADLPIMYLWAPKSITALSVKVGGYVPIADGLIRPQGLTLAP